MLVHNRRTLRAAWVALAGAIILAAWFAPHRIEGSSSRVDTQEASFPSACDRLGMGVAPAFGGVDQYDVAQLGAGWYVDWGARLNPAHPTGLDHIQVINIHEDTFAPDEATLAAIAAANPGVIWSIGNEPECTWQGNSTPEQYARLYHHLYRVIKTHDPSARVTVGGIVQATPLRLQWLDAVLDRYQALYGTPLPVDLWNIHTFILREEKGSWGCEIPAGIPATRGMLWEIQDHDRMDLIRGQVIRFRQWMKDHGERDKELIITEYGILMPDKTGYDFDAARVETFMLRTFEYFMNATDAELGYPADGDRLVQRWAWYSLNDPLFEGLTSRSHLFEPHTKEITPLGRAFGRYTQSLSCPEYVDLVPAALSIDLEPPVTPDGQPTAGTLTAIVRNTGNTDAENISVKFWTGDPSHPIADLSSIPVLPARALATVSVRWANIPAGIHTVGVTVDPRRFIPESDEDNNELSQTLIIGQKELHLPLVPQSYPVDTGF